MSIVVPEQHRPPRLAWGQLVDALADADADADADAGVAASEQELIAAALTIELGAAVLDRSVDALPQPI